MGQRVRFYPSSSEFFYKIGRCGKCMNDSFAAFILSSIILLVAFLSKKYAFPTLSLKPVLICVVLLAMLWLLHLTVYATRFARVRSKKDFEESFASNTIQRLSSSRRKTLVYFGGAFVNVLLITSLKTIVGPKVANTILAQNAYGYVDCGRGVQCNPGNICCVNNGELYCCAENTCCLIGPDGGNACGTGDQC